VDAVWVIGPGDEGSYSLCVAVAAGGGVGAVLPSIVPIKPATTLEPRTANAMVRAGGCPGLALVAADLAGA
jgi:hypothetical protein